MLDREIGVNFEHYPKQTRKMVRGFDGGECDSLNRDSDAGLAEHRIGFHPERRN